MKMKHKRMRFAREIREQTGLHFCDAIRVARAMIASGNLLSIEPSSVKFKFEVDRKPFSCGVECCGFKSDCTLVTEKGRFTTDQLWQMCP